MFIGCPFVRNLLIQEIIVYFITFCLENGWQYVSFLLPRSSRLESHHTRRDLRWVLPHQCWIILRLTLLGVQSEPCLHWSVRVLARRILLLIELLSFSRCNNFWLIRAHYCFTVWPLDFTKHRFKIGDERRLLVDSQQTLTFLHSLCKWWHRLGVVERGLVLYERLVRL